MATTLAPPTGCTAAQALAVAEADALPVYRDLSGFHIDIWQDSAGWHVEYHIRQRYVAGGGPHYLISSNTGEILDKKYYQ